MIYVLTAVHNSDHLDAFFDCIEKQNCRDEILPIIVDASENECCEYLWTKYAPVVVLRWEGVYWGTSLRILRDYLKDTFTIKPEDTVCIINIDRTFCGAYMDLGDAFAHTGDRNIVISRCFNKEGNHISGGLYVDWKKFSFTLSETPNICGTNGLFLRAEDFLKCKISTFLVHHWADFQLVLSLKGYKIYEPTNLVLTMEESQSIHNPKTWKELFSKRCSCNPYYMAIFILLCCPIKYKPINLLRCLWWVIKVKIS
jgi:hypothetical protein